MQSSLVPVDVLFQTNVIVVIFARQRKNNQIVRREPYNAFVRTFSLSHAVCIYFLSTLDHPSDFKYSSIPYPPVNPISERHTEPQRNSRAIFNIAMGLFSCAEPRKPARPVISRPLEASQLHKSYHAVPDRTRTECQRRREAEIRRKAEEKRAQDRERHRREAAEKHRQRNHIQTEDRRSWYRTPMPPLDNRWQGAYDQLNAKGKKPIRADDPWTSDVRQPQPIRQPSRSRVQSRHPSILSPGSRRNRKESALSRPFDPWDWDGLARPEHSVQAAPIQARKPTAPNGRVLTGWEAESSIMRNAKYTLAPKQGKRVLYNEDAATATRRNVGF